MPIGPFPDFDACVAHMMKPKSEGGGGYDEETAKKVCGKMQAELEESFSWAGEIKAFATGGKFIRGEAIHPIKTIHPLEWPQLRVFLEDELKKSAETLIGKPLFLDHWKPLNGAVLGANYEDGALEYVADLRDKDVLQMIRDGQIKHASVQFEWKTLENVNGVAPHGINYQHLSLLKDMLPGDPESSVEIWEGIAQQLKEAKSLPADSETGPKPENKEESELSEENLKDRIKILEEKVEALTKAAEAEWDTEYINDLPDSAFAVVASGGEKDEQGKTVPRNLRKLPYKNAQGNIDLDHLRNALARLNQIEPASLIPAAKKKLCAAARSEKAEDLVSEFCGEEEPSEESVKEQQGNKEPPKAGVPKTDKERLIAHFGEEKANKLFDLIGEEAYKLLPPVGTKRAQEQQERQPEEELEDQGDERQVFMSKCMKSGKTMEQCAAEWKEQHPETSEESVKDLKETVEALKGQIKILEDQNAVLKEELERVKRAGEAIIPSTTTPPSDVLKEIKRLLPERVPMSWGGHYAQLWRNLRNLVKKHESQSS